MNSKIISLADWLQTPPGEYLLAWERFQFDQAVSDIFGYHALQLGLPQLDTLKNNRMPHRWLAEQQPLGDSCLDISAPATPPLAGGRPRSDCIGPAEFPSAGSIDH